MTLEACYFTEKCRWCKQIITGEGHIDREQAKKDFVEKTKEHLKQYHIDLKCKVLVCCYCEKVLIGWSQYSMKHASRELWRRTQEHGKKYHPEKSKEKEEKLHG